jgi:hypothetical protein
MSAHSDPTPDLQSIPARKRKANGAVKAAAPSGEQSDLQELLSALQAMKVGDFSVRMRGDQVGIAGKIADTFNEIVATNQRMAEQLEKVGEQVGKEGKTRYRVKFGQSVGAWAGMEAHGPAAAECWERICRRDTRRCSGASAA